jgi:hypothetical protein
MALDAEVDRILRDEPTAPEEEPVNLFAPFGSNPLEPPGCVLDHTSSRACERGTIGCVVEHEACDWIFGDLSHYDRKGPDGKARS